MKKVQWFAPCKKYAYYFTTKRSEASIHHPCPILKFITHAYVSQTLISRLAGTIILTWF
jgi:hypothetical protein